MHLGTNSVSIGVHASPVVAHTGEDFNLERLKEKRLHSSTVRLIVILLQLGLHHWSASSYIIRSMTMQSTITEILTFMM